jgi:hypothetical protein
MNSTVYSPTAGKTSVGRVDNRIDVFCRDISLEQVNLTISELGFHTGSFDADGPQSSNVPRSV